MAVILAIDGGNSKTDVLLADTAGAILGHARGPGSNHQTLGGIPAAMSRLDTLVRQALDQAGTTARPAVAAVFLAGADLPAELTALHEAVVATAWADESIVDNDMLALLRAGTERPDAVAVVCGAGTNCFARAADGRQVRFPALGHLTGDWGGGYHLGALALWHAIRAEDGRGPATALAEVLTVHFGRSTVTDVAIAIHLKEFTESRLMEVAPAVLAASAAGDPLARELVVAQGNEVVTWATTALRRLDLLDKQDVAVVLGGGVLHARDPVLMRVIEDGLRATAPRTELTVVTDPPVVGAALLGLDALGAGAPEELRARVRALTARR